MVIVGIGSDGITISTLRRKSVSALILVLNGCVGRIVQRVRSTMKYDKKSKMNCLKIVKW